MSTEQKNEVGISVTLSGSVYYRVGSGGNSLEAFEAVCPAAGGNFIVNFGYGGLCLETG